MATVNTVLGPVEASELGFTLSHEHVLLSAAGVAQTYPGFIDHQVVTAEGIVELKAAYDEGVRTIVDVTTFDLGRDIALLEEVSRESGVHIIACTGNHLAVPRDFTFSTPSAIAPHFIREIQDGIEGSGIKAGIIKVASDRGGITPPQEIVLRAAAIAQKETRARISTHTWTPDRVGDAQVRILEEEGVDLNRVYVGHSNDDTDLDYLLGLLNKGVWVGLDRYPGGRTSETPNWERRTEVVKQLIDAGFAQRLMLSHDNSVPSTNPSKEMAEERKDFNPDGYLFITRRVLPRLKELGATDQDINTIMVENPRRFFGDA